MFEKNMYNPDGFRNTVEDGKITGFQFDFKIQYYRGITLSILHDILVEVDGESFPRESIRFTLEGNTFTLDEMETVLHYRWKFGQWATVTVLKEGGLSAGPHHIRCTQVIAPSYMPMILRNSGEYDFTVGEGEAS